ncbi:hypothetical protein Taro_041974 [Colocasia esculenta]|uniref:Disease resistance protein RGA3 n=1 Tax=Colocasia esculenta TaxID=4460 RepID=A0A843WXB1_COLES|nr:hypothetical protein [Colocasia esculenta]
MASQAKKGGVLAYVGTGLERAIEELEQIIHVPKKIRRLISKVNRIKAVMKDAEQKQISSHAVTLWFQEVKQTLLDAEDLFDELATDAAVKSICSDAKSRIGFQCVTRCGLFFPTTATTTRAMRYQMRKMNDRFDRLEAQTARLGLQISTVEDTRLELSTRRQTSSLLPDETSVMGRDREKGHIIDMLLSSIQVAESSSNNKGFTILPIVGMGGMGKTTLAQLVFNDRNVKEHFELMMWVCVSHDPDPVRLTKDITEAALAFKRKYEQCQLTNWDSMQQRLRQEVEEKTFLLVLDDVWEAEQSMWEKLFKPLHFGKQGSKVLVTARNRAFVDKMGAPMDPPIPVGGLSDADIWDLFKRNALRGAIDANGTTSAEYSHLEDIAEYVSRGDYFRLEDHNLVEMPDTVRHMSIWVTEMEQIDINKLCSYEKLRTLLFLRIDYGEVNLRTRDLNKLFQKLKMLRVLGLPRCGIRQMPESLGDLKHLRYIDLEWNNLLENLPESVGNLYNLQVMNLYGCVSLDVLPATMSQLVNLRHLRAESSLVSGIDGLGKLTGLQKLRVMGRKVRELGCMCLLRELAITYLEEVGSREEAMEARLHTLQHLQVLRLEWSGRLLWTMDRDSVKPEVEEEVLQALRPHDSLQELYIEGYGGTKSPVWMELPMLSSFTSLVSVRLQDCPSWLVLPSSSLSQLCHLVYLHIESMPVWEEWSCPDAQQCPSSSTLFFPCLHQLSIKDCPKLKELPPLPPALRRLYLQKVGVPCLPGLWGCSPSGGGIKATSSSHSPPASASLSVLYISYCYNLTSVSGLLHQRLPDLEAIMIENCNDLVSLPESGFGHLISLKRLQIAYCPKLTSQLLMREEEDAPSQHLPHSLEQLEINLCGDAMGGWWWAGLQRLTSIAKLSLCRCPTTAKLLFLSLGRHHHPHLPVTLTELLIDGCRCNNYEQEFTTFSTSSSQSPLVDASTRILRSLTSLKTLTIWHSPNFLRKWGGGGLPSSLERLTIVGDGDLDHECLSTCLHDLISLKEFTLQDSENLRTLPNMSCLTSLGTLDIESCPSIETLEAINLPSSLKNLTLKSFKVLHSLPHKLNCLSSLKAMDISSCPSLQSLPDTLSGLSSLQTLGLSDCHTLQSLPDTLNHLSALKTMSISRCPSIQWLPARQSEIGSTKATQESPTQHKCTGEHAAVKTTDSGGSPLLAGLATAGISLLRHDQCRVRPFFSNV